MNNARAVGYAQTASQIRNRDFPSHLGTAYFCDVNWFKLNDEECRERMFLALQETVPYEAQYITDNAPWYSRSSGYSAPWSPSLKFLGVYGLSVSALSDSTRDVSVTEGILSGGILGRERLAVPRFRFRVQLTAVDEEGLEYGIAWLSKALSEQSCSTHGPSCGSSDLTFMVSCPTEDADRNAPIGFWYEKIDQLTRTYHDVKCTEGPVETDRFNRSENSWGAIMEFTLAAGVPNMFGVAAPYLPIPNDGETVITDVPENFIPHPSAEIGTAAYAVVATNYSLNPSLETNATAWGAQQGQISGDSPTPYIVGERVTGELAAVGTASYRCRLLGTATVAAGRASMVVHHTVGITGRPAGSRTSATVWGALVKVSGSGTLVKLHAEYVFLTAANAQIGIPILMTSGPGGFSGNVFSIRSLVVPATATQLRIRVYAEVDWVSGGATPSDIRLYGDACAVTVP